MCFFLRAEVGKEERKKTLRLRDTKRLRFVPSRTYKELFSCKHTHKDLVLPKARPSFATDRPTDVFFFRETTRASFLSESEREIERVIGGEKEVFSLDVRIARRVLR